MNKTYIIGDIHGQIQPIEAISRTLSDYYAQTLDNTDTIICLGDVGANFFFNKRDIEFKEKLKSYPCRFFLIRGNHEQRPSIMAENNPDKWTMDWYFENNVWIEKEYPNIKYAMDLPYVYNINGHSTLVVPGAYSVDKYYRLANHWTWFEKEQLDEGEKDYGRALCEENDYKFDMVLSHTCPKIYMPTDLFLPTVDQNTVDKSMEEYLGELEYKLDYKLWCFGHYHHQRIYPSFDNKQMAMLSQGNEIINVDKFFETNDIYKAIIAAGF